MELITIKTNMYKSIKQNGYTDFPNINVRVLYYADKIIEIARIQRNSHPVKKICVFSLGEIVEGELIFPGQEHLIDSSLY